MTDDLLTPIETAELLKVKLGTLHAWRMRKRGPSYVRLENRLVRYPRDAIEAWLARSSARPPRPAA